MDRFKNYVNELFDWNEEMKKFLRSEWMDENSELWGKLDNFSDLIESISRPLTDEELLHLQSKADSIHEEMEDYFRKKQTIGDIWNDRVAVGPGKHTLPNLPYPYNALEPYISGEIMELHHMKHHQSYVDGLNKAELELKKSQGNE